MDLRKKMDGERSLGEQEKRMRPLSNAVFRRGGAACCVAGESIRFYLRRGSRNCSLGGSAKSYGRAMAADGGARAALSV
jgi:hypothetical protein